MINLYIVYSLEAVKSELKASSEIDDVVIDGLNILNQLRKLYKEDKSLFDKHLICELQKLKKSIELVDEKLNWSI